MVNDLCTRLQCPCGEWIGLTLTVGASQYGADGSVVLPVWFDVDQFKQDVSDHLLADPTNPAHYDSVGEEDG
jgi:hypothetical protein